MNKDILWIFLGAPRTGTGTIDAHLLKNLKKGEIIIMSRPASKYTKTTSTIKEMPPSERLKVRVIGGHATYFGIHKFFPGKEPRYITFLRDPAERVVSLYNANMRSVSKEEAVPFEKWFDAQVKNETVHFFSLKWNGKEGTIVSVPEFIVPFFVKFMKNTRLAVFLRKIAKKILLIKNREDSEEYSEAKKMINTCWFVGLTEKSAKDMKMIFKRIGVPEKWENIDISGKKETAKSEYTGEAIQFTEKKIIATPDIRAIILKKNASDFKLYSYSQKLRIRKIKELSRIKKI